MLNRFFLRVFVLMALLCAALPGLAPQSGLAQDATRPSSDVLDIILVIDQSGSMHDENDPGNPAKRADGTIILSTDPICEDKNGCKEWQEQDGLPMRQVAAKYFLDYLSIDSLSRPHRVGIIYFGSGEREKNLRFPLFDAGDRVQREHVKNYLDVNVPYLHWTDVNSALESAYGALFDPANQDPTHKPVVVFLSDGRPELASPWPGQDTTDPNTGQTIQGQDSFYQELKGLIQQFADAGVPVYTIAFGKLARQPDRYLIDHCPELFGAGFCPEGLSPYQTVWEYAASQTGGQYYRVFSQDKQEQKLLLFNTYHDIVAHLLGAAPESAGEGELGGTQTVHITIGECRQVVLTAYASHAETVITVSSPSATVVEPTEREKEYAIYSLTDPEPGSWTLKFEGGTGFYQIYEDCQATELRAQILAPAQGEFPACSPLALQAGVWLEEEAEDNAEVAIRVTRPDNTVQTVGLSTAGGGQYANTLAAGDTQITGTYRLDLTAHHAELTAVDKKTIQAVLLPFLEFMSPMPGASVPGGEIPVQVGVKIGCDLETGNLTISGRDTTVTAIVSGAGGEVARALLRDDGQDGDAQSMDGVFNGRLLDVPPGDYQLVITLDIAGDNPASDQISGRLAVGAVVVPDTPTVTPEPTVTPTPAPVPIALVDSDLGLVRPDSDVSLRVRFNTADQSTSQHVRAALTGVPFTLVSEDEFDLPFGEASLERSLTMHIPEDSVLAEGEKEHTYSGALVISQSRGEVTELPFEVTVRTPPNILPLLAALGVALLGVAGVVVYRYVLRNRPRLAGELRYSAVPASVGNIPDQPLSGKKQTVHLSAEMEDTELEFTGMPGPRGGARVTVVRSDTGVQLGGVPIIVGQAHDLYDGATLSAGGYTLVYENLAATPVSTFTDQVGDYGDLDYGPGTADGTADPYGYGSGLDYGAGTDYGTGDAAYDYDTGTGDAGAGSPYDYGTGAADGTSDPPADYGTGDGDPGFGSDYDFGDGY